jgi:transcriptional regulator GlxA family with amidase domain
MLRLRRAWWSGKAGDQLEAEAELKAIAARFFRQVEPMAVTTQRQPAAEGRHAGDLIVQEAITYMRRHHGRPNCMADLQARRQLSEHYFRKLFRDCTGMSPRKYLTTIRMHVARRHLHCSNMAIKQIAAIVGYRNPLYFSRQYHAFWTRWPSEDRELPPSPYSTDLPTKSDG